jgi:hypothetical protein
MSDTRIMEKRTFRLLPREDIGFAKPAIEYTDPDGNKRTRVSHDSKAPEPELARKPNDPGYWTVTVWLPVGSTPTGLIPDPDGPQF